MGTPGFLANAYPPMPKMRRMISTTSMLEPWEGWLGGELLEEDDELEEEDEEELDEELLLLDELLEEEELEDDEDDEGWPEEELCDWLDC